jgi:hypothetical protein
MRAVSSSVMHHEIEREFLRSGIVRRLVMCFLVVALLPLAQRQSRRSSSSALCCWSKAASVSPSPRMTMPRRCTIACSPVDMRLHELARRGDLAVVSRNGNGDTIG